MSFGVMALVGDASRRRRILWGLLGLGLTWASRASD
jgi:hypothetical protein